MQVTKRFVGCKVFAYVSFTHTNIVVLLRHLSTEIVIFINVCYHMKCFSGDSFSFFRRRLLMSHLLFWFHVVFYLIFIIRIRLRIRLGIFQIVSLYFACSWYIALYSFHKCNANWLECFHWSLTFRELIVSICSRLNFILILNTVGLCLTKI